MVYQRLGIPTVATVRWTSDQMIQRLLPQGAVPELTDPSGKIVIAEVPLVETWIGRHLTDVEEQTGARIAYVTRLGEGTLPRPDMVVQQGDLVHVAVPRDDLARVERLLRPAPGRPLTGSRATGEEPHARRHRRSRQRRPVHRP